MGVLGFSTAGNIASGTGYLFLGNAAVDAQETMIRFHHPVTAMGMSIRSRVAPGAGHTETWTVRKTGQDTGISVSLSDTDTSGSSHFPVGYNSSDDFSLKQVVSLGSSLNDIQIVVEFY